MKKDLVLFEKKGASNTESCIESISKRMKKLKINSLVVASTSGETGSKAIDFFEGTDVKVVIVSHQYGFKDDGKNELDEKYKEKIESSKNATLVTTPDVLTVVPQILRGKYGGSTYLDLIADTLRIFSQGMKVCVECVIQAADTGNIPIGEEVAAIAGTASGADTGIILTSQHSHELFNIDMREIVCMPRKH